MEPVPARMMGRDPSYLVLDLDGTLTRGRDVVPGARELLDRFGDRFVIVSNNSTHSAAELAAELGEMGLAVAESQLVLAGMMAVEAVARDHGGARVLAVGSPGLARAAGAAGLELVQAGADLVLLGRDEAFTYGKLAQVANEIERGAMLIATNPDRSHPGPNGGLVPETGALLSAVLACATPHRLRVIGKPAPLLFEEALRRLGAAPADCVMIGDNPSTDAVGAERVGMRCLLLGAGPDRDAPDLQALLGRLGTLQDERGRR